MRRPIPKLNALGDATPFDLVVVTLVSEIPIH